MRHSLGDLPRKFPVVYQPLLSIYSCGDSFGLQFKRITKFPF